MSTPEPGQAPRGGAHRAQSPSQSRSLLLPLLGVLAVLAALGLAAYMLMTNGADDGAGEPGAGVSPSTTTSASKTAEPSKSASPSGEPTKSKTNKPTSQGTKKQSKTPVAQPVPQIPVYVFNQTTITGLAGQFGSQLESQGWNVVGVANWRGFVPEDTVYYYSGDQAAAQQLADDAGIARVWPATAPMRGDALTLILATTDRK